MRKTSLNLIGFMAIFIISLTINGCSSTKKDKTLENYRNLCKNEMNYQIKSPSTAKYSEAEIEIYPNPYSNTKIDERIINSILKGYVDSQNGFGAEIRTYFTCYTFGQKTEIKTYGDGSLPLDKAADKAMKDLQNLVDQQ